MRKVGSILLNAGLMVVVFLAASAWVSRNMLPTDGQVAPELQGVTLAGEPYDLADFGDRPALIYYFAPWCKICAASSGNLTRLRRWRDVDDLEIVADQERRWLDAAQRDVRSRPGRVWSSRSARPDPGRSPFR